MNKSNRAIFVCEFVGTFIVVVFATGSVVIDAQFGDQIWGSGNGIFFIAFAPFVGVALGVYLFGKTSMAHFNPAVTIGYFITGYISKIQVLYYLVAEITGAITGSLLVLFLIGDGANLGANAPNYTDFSLGIIIPIEILATGLLMAVIFVVVYTRGLKGFGGIAIGGIVGLDILFFAVYSGASMNPARALAPALLSGFLDDLWLYWTAPFAGTIITSILFRKILYNHPSKKY